MAQMTAEVLKLLERALMLSVEEQEALADSLISNLGGIVDEGVQAAWETEIERRVAELESGEATTTSWEEVRRRNLAKLPHAQLSRRSSIKKLPPPADSRIPPTPLSDPL
jgi:putative addiction module component (TIGR02574 family)